jgi:hypothetical protein
MGPTGFIVYARDFLTCFRCYSPGEPFSPAKYYLACRSVELSLKAYLALKRVTTRDIKNEYRHDLSKLVRGSADLGLAEVVAISKEERSEIEKANQWYNRKGSEYFNVKNITVGRDTLPDLTILESLAQRLIDVLQPICLSSAQQP